jgi:hypothetical protein
LGENNLFTSPETENKNHKAVELYLLNNMWKSFVYSFFELIDFAFFNKFFKVNGKIYKIRIVCMEF